VIAYNTMTADLSNSRMIVIIGGQRIGRTYWVNNNYFTTVDSTSINNCYFDEVVEATGDFIYDEKEPIEPEIIKKVYYNPKLLITRKSLCKVNPIFFRRIAPRHNRRAWSGRYT